MPQNLKIRLIVSDVEGCITPANRGIMVTEEINPIAAYCAAARQDKSLPPIVLCTGRQIPYAECVAQIIGAFFPGFPSIVENGAFLYDVARNDVIPNFILNPQLIPLIDEVRHEAEKLTVRYGAKKEYGKDICISLNPPSDLSIEQFFEAVREELQPWSEILEITHSKSAVDITPKGIDKASGVRQLAELTGISPVEMLGIGDTKGDLSMLNLVGVPTGPSNASTEVREIASFIAPSFEAKGVSEILRYYTSWK